MPFVKGQSGIAASTVIDTVDLGMLSSLGMNPLCITAEELAAIDMCSEDAQLINAALEHVTLTTTAGLLEDQIYISKIHLYSLVPQETLRRTSSMTVHKRFHELKACVTSPTPCECMVCDKLDTWQQEWEENPNYDKRKLVSLLLTCLQVDTTLCTEAFDQTGGELLWNLTQFALHKAELHASLPFLKCVGLEVACYLSIDTSGSQATCYSARPDLVVKIRNRTNCSVLATGEVSRSPTVQTYIAAMGYLAKSGSKYILCIVLHKNNTINLYLGVNQRETVIDSEYSGPISLVSLMGGESYDLHNEAKVITLIKHLGSALKKIAVRNVRDRRQTRPGTSEDESRSKRRHKVSTLIKTTMFCCAYNIPK